MRLHPEPLVATWIADQSDDSLYLSVVTIGEIARGLALLPKGRRRERLKGWFTTSFAPAFADRILPVSLAIAERWAMLSALRSQAGRPLGMGDGLIAATASEHDLVVVTRNEKDFFGLDVEVVNP